MNPIGKLLYLILPIMLAGECNMIFVKIPLLVFLKKPMDGGKVLSDGRRLFGDNKTWKGFLGMILLGAFWLFLFATLSTHFRWARKVSLIPLHELDHAWFWGGVWGLGYVLFELPNSYVKRRLRIDPGTNAPGMKGKIFIFIDQSDSVLGCILFMLFFYVPSLIDGIMLFVLGTVVHIVVNMLLYLVRLKRQMF